MGVVFFHESRKVLCGGRGFLFCFARYNEFAFFSFLSDKTGIGAIFSPLKGDKDTPLFVPSFLYTSFFRAEMANL